MIAQWKLFLFISQVKIRAIFRCWNQGAFLYLVILCLMNMIAAMSAMCYVIVCCTDSSFLLGQLQTESSKSHILKIFLQNLLSYSLQCWNGSYELDEFGRGVQLNMFLAFKNLRLTQQHRLMCWITKLVEWILYSVSRNR